MAKYGHVAEQNRLQFIPAIFSHAGQIHAAFRDLLREQTRHKLIAFEGHAKSSLTLKVATLLLQGKRNRRVAVRISLIVVRVCGSLGGERLKVFYIANF